ncbi:YqcC family protein [Pseudomonas sp. LS44]|uniref:YqcC family protein n=1 Tax=Pseudomonas sp. LS44 TaxID=1357074 RepID=UPI00215B004F|nr:YqcC family protein [Pseudomonas sp. LS44]UVE17026.1 YqcC family protein [Pseudomonas sp. LS44]
MDSRVSAVAEQLLLIERELRVQGWWSLESPAEAALASQEPFCVDTLEFEEWLQWIFLPRMKIILESGGPLPEVSGIRHMADVVYREQPLKAKTLLSLLDGFDRLITRAV